MKIGTRIKVLVAGMGGASLGTEIVKVLAKAGDYSIYGCDISAHAYGHFMPECTKTRKISLASYIEDIIGFCAKNSIEYVIPGGEGPLELLNQNRAVLIKNRITPVLNSEKVIEVCSDKSKTFHALREMGISVPTTFEIEEGHQKIDISFPCVVKPATGTGGSSFVFLVADREELAMYISYLSKNGKKAVIQEYVPHHEGEYTIGVLSLTNGDIAGSICLERTFDNKLSVMHRSSLGLISSGYTQGFIRNKPELCKAAEKIAQKIGSTGPLNIQGRIKNGQFVPFEINPRFSASTFLRSLAGFDELNIYLQHLVTGRTDFPPFVVREGYCARSFTELFIEKERLND